MRQNFLRAARQILIGPSLAAAVAVPGFARAEPVSPPIKSVPVVQIDINAFDVFVQKQLPDLDGRIQDARDNAHNALAMLPLYNPFADDILASALAERQGARAEILKAYLIRQAELDQAGAPVQTALKMQRLLSQISPDQLASILARTDTHAVTLKDGDQENAACLNFQDPDPSFLWSEVTEDLGSKNARTLPDASKFVADHEATHCGDAQLNADNIDKASGDIILTTEVTADLNAARQHKDDLALLNAVAKFRIMEPAVGYVMLDAPLSLGHSTEFELWRYIGTLEGKQTHVYLNADQMKRAFEHFKQEAAPVLNDSDFVSKAAELYPPETDVETHLFTNLYLASRIMLEERQIKSPDAIMIAREYVAAYEYFDTSLKSGFQDKVTELLQESRDQDAEPARMKPIPKTQPSSPSARP